MKTMAKKRLLISKLGLNAVLKLRRGGPGYKLAAGAFTGVILYTYFKGPKVESEIIRWGLAGIASSLFVEILCQPIDTINMKTKIDKKFELFSFLKRKGVTSLMRGIQPVIYGMAISSFLYFVLYTQIKGSIKHEMDSHQVDKTSLKSVFVMSAGASALANLWAIGIYYPYDLVKTRMQIIGEYRYTNIIDAFYKILKENNSKYKFQNFYRGFGMYSLTFITFTTLEFSIYETIMMYLSRTLGKPAKLNHSHRVGEHVGIFEHREDKRASHILIASAIAGAIGGFLTNPLEFLAVHKQADHTMHAREVFKTTAVYDIFLKGSLFRTVYYSSQAVLIFFLLEKFGSHLNCEI